MGLNNFTTSTGVAEFTDVEADSINAGSVNAGSLSDENGNRDHRENLTDESTFDFGSGGNLNDTLTTSPSDKGSIVRFKLHIDGDADTDWLDLTASPLGNGDYNYTVIQGRSSLVAVDGDDQYVLYHADQKTRHIVQGEMKIAHETSGGLAGISASIRAARQGTNTEIFQFDANSASPITSGDDITFSTPGNSDLFGDDSQYIEVYEI